MSVQLTCNACAARLKLPPGCTKTKIRCPKCNARMDISDALNASAYLPTIPIPAKFALSAATTDTPLPDLAIEPPAPPSLPAVAEREEDPLPYPSLDPTSSTRPTPPPLPDAKPQAEPPLSLDDSAAATPQPPASTPAPFRVAARVTADSAKQFTGPCEAVLVPHGLFLESMPFRPFVYAPVGSPVFTPAPGAVVVSTPDGRAVTVELLAREADRVAEDVAAFLAGERGVPEAGEYRRSAPWLILLAVLFAAGAGVAAVVTARTIDLDWTLGLWFGIGFATAGLLANAAVSLLTRMPTFGKVAVMAATGVALTGVCLFAAAAYLAGRREAQNQPPVEPSQQQPLHEPSSPSGSPPPARRYLPTAVDVACRDGVYRFDDGPADVTAMALGVDGTILIVGYKDGTTRVWRLDHPTIDPFSIGPKADGAPTRIEFDSSGSVVYMACNGGTVAARWNDPPATPVKIPGDQFVMFPFATGERFAAVRGNALVVRYVPTNLIRKPMGKAAFHVTTAVEEGVPADTSARLVLPQRPTFLAWHPTGQLLGGLRDGVVVSWGETGSNPMQVSRDHKAAVRAWAASPATWDFATGDDKGMVGLWENKAMKPRLFAGATGAVTQLAYSPSGSHLAVGDASGAVRVWSLGAERAVVKVNRVGSQVAFGPNDDTVLLSDGKHLELWALDELAKQP